MLYREIIAVCSEIRAKHRNVLCGQKVEFLNVKPSGIYRILYALKGSSHTCNHNIIILDYNNSTKCSVHVMEL